MPPSKPVPKAMPVVHSAVPTPQAIPVQTSTYHTIPAPQATPNYGGAQHSDFSSSSSNLDHSPFNEYANNQGM